MNIEKSLVICVVLMVCLAGFGVWTYAGMDNLQNQMADLEAQNDQLETQVADLENQVSSFETQVENLTNIIVDFTFMETEELKILGLTWTPLNATSNAYATLTVKNTGETTLTVLNVIVNGDTASMEPTTLTLASQVQGTIKATRIGAIFLSGTKYDFALITASGNTFLYVATAP